MATPTLPTKHNLDMRMPENGQGIVPINYRTPLEDAGKGLGAALGSVAKVLEPKKPEADKPSEDVKLRLDAVNFVQGVSADAANAADPGQAGIDLSDRLNQGEEQFIKRAGASLPQNEAALRAIFNSGRASLEQALKPQRDRASIAAVEDKMAPVAVAFAGLGDDIARTAIASPVYAAIQKLREDGLIDDSRAQAMSNRFQGMMVEEDVKKFPPQLQMAMLEERPGGEEAQNFYRRAMGKERADARRAQAVQEDASGRREAGTKDLVERYGLSPEGEAKAVAEIDAKHGDDPRFRPLYEGRLAQARVQQGRDWAKSADTVYQLVFEGRAQEIDPADRKRLAEAGQLDAVMDGAQYARSADHKGDLLFKERLLAMSPAERAGYGLGELAKRLSAKDFLEVVQGAAGEEDPGRRERMRDFVATVQSMLRSVAVGSNARPEQVEGDRGLLAMIREELDVRVADAEQQKKRKLSPSEYRAEVKAASGAALLRHDRIEQDQATELWRMEKGVR